MLSAPPWAEDRGGGDNNVQFINIGRVGDISFKRCLFIVRAGGDIIKAEFIHTKRTNCLTKMKIGIHLEELK